ncbi:SRR1-like protein [Lingula anatina]|uniref:SRR1-like protein n=1 Tax=Lingula anatina TaxID=7574 RepID=A0A1S3IS12_LINAN|nr:SRR1-like protein [Lingula anatina]|eukprot:XP_013400992.1 SRR1-like protein [Lingula anatina]
MFSKTEIRALNSLGCSLITVNEEGKRQAEGLTIFLMLHCGKPLYNNLLWANWKARLLQNVIIVGNSFKNMELNIPHRIMEEEASYIIKILPYVTEVPVKNNFVHDDIFNNTSIHCFPACNLEEVQRIFWDSSPEPIYEKDAEIILKKEATLETM